MPARDEVERLEQLFIHSARDRDHLPELEIPHDGYLGEYPWHPAFANEDGCRQVGRNGEIPIQMTVADWYVERSGHDYSVEDSFNLTIPAPALVRGLQLRLADGRSFAYATANGAVLFKDPSIDEPGFSAAVVDHAAMRAFLDAAGQELLWVFTGEKSAHCGRRLYPRPAQFRPPRRSG